MGWLNNILRRGIAKELITGVDLSNQQLRTLTEPIDKYSRLQRLSLSNNNLTEFPKSLLDLADLQYLDLSGNNLTEIPDSISHLQQLRHLNVSKNQLQQVPDSIGQLTALQHLDIADNRLTSLPETIAELRQLRYLDCSNNHLVKFPEQLFHLSLLQELYLHGNDALPLPTSVLGPTSAQVTAGDAQPFPPQVIFDFYRRWDRGTRPFNEAKLIVLGSDGAGKTSLVDRLAHNKFSEHVHQSNALRVIEWSLPSREDVRLHIWDFDRQEIAHSLHRMFLTQNCLYLVVLHYQGGRESAEAQEWLDLIGKYESNSPVIVVLNKINEQRFDLHYDDLEESYPASLHFVSTDCKDGTGIDELRQVLVDEVNQLHSLQEAVPSNWFAVKHGVVESRTSLMTFDAYRKLCTEHEETNRESQEQLVRTLHNLGVALNYWDEPRLRSLIIINPHWLVEGIAKLLNIEQLSSSGGEVHLADVARILDPDQYPPEYHSFLLDLMSKFGLAFESSSRIGHYLIPGWLETAQPQEARDFPLETCLRIEYRYLGAPEGILPRLIARTPLLSNQQPRWRTGVLFELIGNRALIRADTLGGRISIAISGPTEGRRSLLAIIRRELENIHQELGLQPQLMIPIPAQGDEFIAYQHLRTYEREGKDQITIPSGADLIELDVTELLNCIEPVEARVSLE